MSDKKLTTHDLLRMHEAELLNYFSKLAPPKLDEMDGEYLSRALELGGFWRRVIALVITNWLGLWLGKAFTPVNKERGSGYNVFLHNRKGVVRHLRMETYIAKSSVDGGLSYTVDYSGLGGHLGAGRDEIRKVSDDLYLAFGYMLKRKNKPGKLYGFILEGPSAPFVGPIAECCR